MVGKVHGRQDNLDYLDYLKVSKSSTLASVS